MSERLTVGAKVRIVVDAVVTGVHSAHGLCYDVALPQRDYSWPRALTVDPDEVSATPAGPEERGEGLREAALLGEMARRSKPEYEPGFEVVRGILARLAATPAPTLGAEERLRAALIPLATYYADHLFHPEDHQPDDECWMNLYRAIVGLDKPEPALSGGSVDE